MLFSSSTKLEDGFYLEGEDIMLAENGSAKKVMNVHEMSLVGTRPPTLDEWEKYDFNHRARMAIRPGITGMWQVSGRSDITDFEKVVELDTEYIKKMSFLFDIKLILKTIKNIFTGDGAK